MVLPFNLKPFFFQDENRRFCDPSEGVKKLEAVDWPRGYLRNCRMRALKMRGLSSFFKLWILHCLTSLSLILEKVTALQFLRPPPVQSLNFFDF